MARKRKSRQIIINYEDEQYLQLDQRPRLFEKPACDEQCDRDRIITQPEQPAFQSQSELIADSDKTADNTSFKQNEMFSGRNLKILVAAFLVSVATSVGALTYRHFDARKKDIAYEFIKSYNSKDYLEAIAGTTLETMAAQTAAEQANAAHTAPQMTTNDIRSNKYIKAWVQQEYDFYAARITSCAKAIRETNSDEDYVRNYDEIRFCLKNIKKLEDLLVAFEIITEEKSGIIHFAQESIKDRQKPDTEIKLRY